MAFTRHSVTRALGAVAFAAILSMPSGALWAQDKDKDAVVARVNGVDIHENDLAFAESTVGPSLANVPPDQKHEALVNFLIDVTLAAQAANREKLPDRPEVKRLLAFDRDRLLMEALLRDAGNGAGSDAAEHEVYDEVVKHATNEPEVHARHILVPTEDEAKAIVAELKAGGDFAALAKEKSKDPSAVANGGDLGYFTKDQMVPEFADVAFKLEKGQISDPVKSQFGWHVIEVEDKRVKPTPTFAELQPQIKKFVARRAQGELIDSLRKSATIERLDKPAAPDASLNPAAPAKK